MAPPLKQALWDLGVRRRRHPALEKGLAVDTLVVGAGITGLTTATVLSRAGARVAVVEAGRVASGTSGGTSAHFTEVPDISYSKLVDRLGEEGARTFARAYRTGLAWIEREIGADAIRCDFAAVPAFQYSEDEGDRERLQEEQEAAGRLGVAAEWAAEMPLPFATAGGIRFPRQAQLHPVRYLDGLARSFVAAGGLLFEHSRVTDWQEKDGGEVSVEAGPVTIRAGKLVLATHTPPNFNPLQTELIPRRSYLLALRLRDEPPSGLFWDSDQPYHYFRSVPAPDRTLRLLLLGGEDHTTGHEKDTAERYRRLEAWARERFAVEAVEARWSAQLYEPADGLPYIGRSPFAERVFLATGFAGVGLSAGTMAGLLLADLVLERDNPWAKIFDATRVRPVAAAPGFVRENAASAAAFISDRLKPAEAASVDDVPRGEGRILKHGGERLAVYRAPSGRLVARSPVCTHLGCIVRWNTAEATWDCPCHGGRFSPGGGVLEGPPTSPLEPREL